MVTAILREMILTGSVQHGTQMRQRDLAAQLGVSPTPVREALRRLEAEGLLQSDPHRGSTVIASWSGEDNMRIRAVLEALAAERAAERIDAATLAELEAINREFSEVGTSDPMRREALNARFHSTVIDAAESPTLVSLVSLLLRASPRPVRAPQSGDSSAAQHSELIAELRKGDPSRAADLAKQHVLGDLAHQLTADRSNPHQPHPPADASSERD